MENFNLNETSSKLVKTFEPEISGYKGKVHLTVNKGQIENLNGYLRKADEQDNGFMEGINFNAYKREGKWYTNVSGVSNEENDLVTDICVALVDSIVAEYEHAE